MKHKIIMAIYLGILALVLLTTQAVASSVPNPTVIGPIPVTVPLGDPSHNYPYLATAIDLASMGYIEEEFFIEGLASNYNTPTGATGSLISSGNPYKTRVVVRRPISPQHFNGKVILEWYNVTAQYDLEVDWFESNEHFIRSGYAWVGVSAQRVGVKDLKTWSPNRYGTLDVTVGNTITNDSLCYDIYSQAAQAIRSPLGIDLLGGLQAKLIIATGHSQSAGRLVTYHNSIHPLHGVLDGFMIHGSDGALRGDLNVKVMKVRPSLTSEPLIQKWIPTITAAGRPQAPRISEIRNKRIILRS